LEDAVAIPRTLDRLPEFDPKSRNFPIRALIPSKPPRSYTWESDKVLDQGTEGACVGYGWSQELLCSPAIVPGVNNLFARGVYVDARKVDEWPGEAYEGTSVIAGARVIKVRGFMAEYRWAFSVDDLVMAIGYEGPAVLGTNWYTGMADTDRAGDVHVTGKVEGGHCIAAIGVDIEARRFILVNSWGESWGIRGRCYLSFDDMERLIHEEGEMCIPVGRVVP